MFNKCQEKKIEKIVLNSYPQQEVVDIKLQKQLNLLKNFPVQ
jgi:hypothetical protein